jgi:hypothetical protein
MNGSFSDLNPFRVVRAPRRCVCSEQARDAKVTVSNGMRLIRVKYGIPYIELPDLDSKDLDKYLLYQLRIGTKRPSVAFPRSQGRPDEEGLVSLKRLGRAQRWEFSHSLASIKRNMPDGCALHTPSKLEDWKSQAYSIPPPPSSEYLAFVDREITRLFRPGWDRNYIAEVNSFVAKPSSRQKCPVTRIGQRADVLWSGNREEFVETCLLESSKLGILRGRYKEVTSAGKVRPLVIFDQEVDLLGPLHNVLYDHISRNDWLLRGPPTQQRISSALTGSHQTSVDLVSATDGLLIEVAERMLEKMFFTSRNIPRSLRAFALRSLRPSVRDQHGNPMGPVSKGQMMGAYLSFPLLCLQSYVAARWAARRDKAASFLVNGDDTLISSDRFILKDDFPEFIQLNDKKTIRSLNVAEINSTAFLLKRGKWREVRHLRRGGFLNNYAGIMHGATACINAGPHWTDAFIRSRIGSKWKFLPLQLGFFRTRVAYRRTMSMQKTRLHTELPPVIEKKVLDPELSWTHGSPDEDEVEALRAHMWEHARDVGVERMNSPTVGSVRQSFRYRKSAPRYYQTYLCWRIPPPVRQSREMYLCPDTYLSERYKGALIALDCFLARQVTISPVLVQSGI